MMKIKIRGRNFTAQQFSRLINPIMQSAIETAKTGISEQAGIFLPYIETLDTANNWADNYSVKMSVDLEKWVFKIYNHKCRVNSIETGIEFEERKYRKYELEDLLNRIFGYAQDASKEQEKSTDEYSRGLCSSFVAIMEILMRWLQNEEILVNVDLEKWINMNLRMKGK